MIDETGLVSFADIVRARKEYEEQLRMRREARDKEPQRFMPDLRDGITRTPLAWLENSYRRWINEHLK